MLSHMGIEEPLAYFHNNGRRHVRRAATERAGLNGLPAG